MARYLGVCHVCMLSEKERDVPSQLSQRDNLIKLVVLYGPRKKSGHLHAQCLIVMVPSSASQ